MPTYRGLIGNTLGPVQTCHNCNPGPGGDGYYVQYCDSPSTYIFVSSVNGCDGNQPALMVYPYNSLNIGDVVKIRLGACGGIITCVTVTSIVNGNYQSYPEGYIDLDLNPSIEPFDNCGQCDSSSNTGGPGGPQ